MTTPPPLRQRPLIPGRGRVYPMPCRCHWNADYRAPDGTLHGAYAVDIADAHDWIRTTAKKAQK